MVEFIKIKNHSGDISPTGSQMPRLLGLAQASKIYRNLKIKNSKKIFLMKEMKLHGEQLEMQALVRVCLKL